MDEQDLYPEPKYSTVKIEPIKEPVSKGDVLIAIAEEIPSGINSSIKLDKGGEYKVLYSHYAGIFVKVRNKIIFFAGKSWKLYFRKKINNIVKIS